MHIPELLLSWSSFRIYYPLFFLGGRVGQFGTSWLSSMLFFSFLFAKAFKLCHLGWASPVKIPPQVTQWLIGWGIPKPWSFFGEAIPLLIWRCAWVLRHAERHPKFLSRSPEPRHFEFERLLSHEGSHRYLSEITTILLKLLYPSCWPTWPVFSWSSDHI